MVDLIWDTEEDSDDGAEDDAVGGAVGVALQRKYGGDRGGGHGDHRRRKHPHSQKTGRAKPEKLEKMRSSPVNYPSRHPPRLAAGNSAQARPVDPPQQSSNSVPDRIREPSVGHVYRNRRRQQRRDSKEVPRLEQKRRERPREAKPGQARRSAQERRVVKTTERPVVPEDPNDDIEVTSINLAGSPVHNRLPSSVVRRVARRRRRSPVRVRVRVRVSNREPGEGGEDEGVSREKETEEEVCGYMRGVGARNISGDLGDKRCVIRRQRAGNNTRTTSSQREGGNKGGENSKSRPRIRSRIVRRTGGVEGGGQGGRDGDGEQCRQPR